MAFWQETPTKTKEVLVTLGDGLNLGLPGFDIGESEATFLRELDSRKYPAAAVRPGRSTFALDGTTSPNGLGSRDNADLHQLDGNTWRYWAPTSTAWQTLSTSLTSTGGRIEEYLLGAASTQRLTLMMNGNEKRYWDGSASTAAALSSNAPDTKLFTVHRHRIYAFEAADIVFNALNLPNDWTSTGIAGAGRITISNARGDGSAITSYGDHVVGFTEFSMHELLGTDPENFELVDVPGDIGCISDRSLAVANARLYWAWFDGIYQYAGGLPKKISTPVDAIFRDINLDVKHKIASGSIGDYLYMAVPTSNSTNNNLILKYDTRLAKWYAEEGSFVDFVTIGKTLYGVDQSGGTWNMRDLSLVGVDGSTAKPIAWSWISKPFIEGEIEGQKVVSGLRVVATVSTGSTSFTVGYSTNVENNDSTSFKTIASSTVPASSNTQNTRIQVPTTDLQNVDWYRLRLAGTGDATVHFLQKKLRVKRR